MLEDVCQIRRVVLACGVVDLRKGIDGLSMIIGDRCTDRQFGLRTVDKNVLPGQEKLDYLMPWPDRLPDECKKPRR